MTTEKSQQKTTKTVPPPRLRFKQFEGQGEWEERAMGSLFSFLGNNSLSREKLNYDSGEVKNIHYGDIHTEFASHFFIDLEKVPFINAGEDVSRFKEENFLREGDLILADASEDMNDIGKAIEIMSLESQRAVSGLHTILARPIEGNFSPGFLGHLFRSEYVRRQIQKESQGAKVLGLSATRLAGINLPAPILPEQQHIAATLSSLDDLITAHTDKLEALRQHKRGLMQALFPAEGERVPRLRFPEFAGAGEWEEKKLGRVLTVANGRDYKHLKPGDIPVYGTGGYMLSVDDYLHDGESVTIGRKGTIDKPDLLTGKFWAVDTLFYTHSYKETTAKFVLYIFQQINWRDYNSASGVPSLTKSTIDDIEVALPTLPEQQRIADALSSLDDLITAQADKIAALQEFKRGLMQGLFPSTTAAAQEAIE